MSLWLTEEEADTYFLTRSGAALYWDSGVDKTSELTTDKSDVVRSGLFEFPEEASQAMKDAVCEQALFRLRDDGIDVRAGIRAQGVVQAGIVQEVYGGAAGVPVSPQALALLADIQSAAPGFGQFEVSR